MKSFGLPLFLKNRHLLLALNAALAAVLLVAFLFFVRSLTVSMFSGARIPAARPRPAAGKTVRPLTDYAPIFTNNPFGFPGGELRPLTSSLDGPEGAVSRTDISLIGTVAGGRAVSYAIFSDQAGKQDVFRTGDQVYALGRLDKVDKDRVFLRSSGGVMEIPLADITTIREVSRPSGQTPQTFGRRTGDSSYIIDQQRVRQALEKPDQIMTDARFLPHLVNGRQQGFVLSEVKPGGIYQSLGLRNGDVLVRINDFEISGPEAALQAFTALRGIDRAQLDIIRGGGRMTLTYQIR